MKQGHKLPIGIQIFRDLREEDYIYVDKTEFAYRLATEGKFYFLSRPRRFGKSLFLSTLKELFLGSKELFEGLWIEKRWDWSQKNPVVHLSFAGAGYKEIGLDKALHEMADQIAEQRGVPLTAASHASRFRELLRKLAAREGKVVVLIDEYDKPIIDYLENPEQAKINREILKDFYIVLKDAQEYLRFVFITGISRFSKVSVFSALNHLDDISMGKGFADICGYTQMELESVFPVRLEKAAFTLQLPLPQLVLEMARWYNGYSWDGKIGVYNPFSILNFLKKQEFEGYWFITGTPDFLAKMAQRQRFYDLDHIETQTSVFDTYDVEDLNLQALLFQTGYLTIKEKEKNGGPVILGYPNFEVRQAFSSFLVSAYADIKRENMVPIAYQLKRAFLKNDLPAAMDLVNSIFASIPHSIFDGSNEAYFHSLVHVIFSFFGTYIESEVNTNRGRIDSVILAPDCVYILEFKMNASAQTALDQIKEKGYAQKYRSLGKPVVGVGINFESGKREIGEWKEEILFIKNPQ